MRAMVLEHGGPGAQLQALDRPVPTPMGQDVLLRVLACGVCRTDLHLLDGELPAHRRQSCQDMKLSARWLPSEPE